jgi:hypothetical protein
LDRYETAQQRLYASFVSRLESDSEGYINRHTVLDEAGERAATWLKSVLMGNAISGPKSAPANASPDCPKLRRPRTPA